MSPTPGALGDGRTRGTLRVRLPSPSPCSPHSSLGSSDPSPQSSSPSHFQRAGMHLPESLHRNSSTPQVICAGGEKQDDTHMGRGDGIGTARSHFLPERLVPAARSRVRHPCTVQTGQDATLSCSPPRGTSRWDRSRQSHITAARSTCSSAGTEQGPSSRRQTHAVDRPQRSSWCLEPPSPLPAGCLLQLAGSSEPSTQSLSRSHTQTRGMQRLVMAHWNWLGAQVTSAAGGEAESGEAAGRQGSASHRPTETTPQCGAAHRCSRDQSKALRLPW